MTVGPGYDMGGKSPDSIISDLIGIGISIEVATSASLGAGFKGKRAGQFVLQNKQVLNLSLNQQQALFDVTVSRYVDRVRAATPVSLLPRMLAHEFDAMLSLAWNLRRYGHYDFNASITSLDMTKADRSVRGLIGGGPGSAGRRVREAVLLTEATYHNKPLTLRNTNVDFEDDVPDGDGKYA